VFSLQKHFGQANEDVRQIMVSAEKLEKRGARIKEVEFSEQPDTSNVIPAPMTPKLQTN
jgi:DNA recombination protein RmuC